MDQQRKTLRIGAAVILCAVVLRLTGSGAFHPVVQALSAPNAASFLMYMETGRILRPQMPTLPPAETAPATTAPATTAPAQIEKPAFSAEDAALVGITYNCGYTPDISALLTQPLSWDLYSDGPAVLILHTHATESYTPTADAPYEPAGAYRTLDENHNMLCIGDAVAQTLEEAGIGVLHDRTLHDYPSYSGSYNASRQTAQAYLDQYPSIRLILDLHRDAAEDGNGNQMRTFAQVDGQDAAQLMLVIGSDAGGLDYPNWQENLSLAVKLQAQLERQYPGICRKLNFCAQRYNQDLLSGYLLVEVGSAGNTRAEALVAAKSLANSVISLAGGTANSS